ncbi:capsular polysaccharide biosynthesis protein [Primorskyibacter sp. S187A]|uniref:capsular polysaccharide biosynthesis protein n=1 Tax=Primorskyibacter sp. S187A TaxID=3415130 RepID=UPI003C7A2168
MSASPTGDKQNAGAETRRRLYVYNGGFLWKDKQIRRILHLAGYDISLGLPSEDDLVGVWGASPTSHRGQNISQTRGAGLIRVEDAFLRSLHPGRAGEPPLGLLIDPDGLHFDPTVPSYLEKLLATHPLDDTALLQRARDGIARIKAAHLTKYSAVDPYQPPPAPGYVLVIDQTKGDASVTASGGSRADFLEMLVFAQEEHPGCRVIIKTHPESRAGFREGYFTDSDTNDRISFLSDDISPWALFEGAVGVYSYSSQMGFEAIFAGHKPRIFGQPFYAGWGLTQDERPVPRRTRRLTQAQLFAAAMILAPTWYDPYRDRLCPLEDVLSALEARTRAWREDRAGWVASGMRLWKRKALQDFFGQQVPIQFADASHPPRRHMIWASKATPPAPAGTFHVEDGFLRSKGLGAALTPPLSLVLDDLGIYYDPRHPSRLEALLNKAASLPPHAIRRAEALRRKILYHGLSKYNLTGTRPDLPEGHRVLVVGQVEDDASILTGTRQQGTHTNLGLLQAARNAHPDAILIYKPHPDVEAGLRKGLVPQARSLADIIADQSNAVALLNDVDEVWTMTSLLGFEAVLRGIPVTTLGVPFYAGWGLTHDLDAPPERRRQTLTLDQLVHAALIEYPRYHDPLTNTACPPEVIVDRLANDRLPKPGWGKRSLSKIQGLLASYAHMWR